MNENIIAELKAEHKAISVFFSKIDVEEILEEKKKLVADLRKLVSEHLHKENTIVYPVLLKSNDKEVLNLGSSFLNSMMGYQGIFSSVVDRITESTGALSVETAKDYENIRDRIKDRMFVEEVALFPAYEKEQNGK